MNGKIIWSPQTPTDLVNITLLGAGLRAAYFAPLLFLPLNPLTIILVLPLSAALAHFLYNAVMAPAIKLPLGMAPEDESLRPISLEEQVVRAIRRPCGIAPLISYPTAR